MDAETAVWVAAEQVLAKMRPSEGDEFVITTAERVGQTWVVYWNSKCFVETQCSTDALAGNGPILVADDYAVTQAGTARAIEFYVREFEARAT